VNDSLKVTLSFHIARQRGCRQLRERLNQTKTVKPRTSVLQLLATRHRASFCHELLFDIISTAYERQGMIITTNLPFENWTEVLGSERLTAAALDRLTHRCHILETRAKVIGSRTPNNDDERKTITSR